MLRIALLALLCACTFSRPEPHAPKRKKEHFLYVLHSQKGTFDPIGQLTLHGINSHVLFFSSLPIQEAGSISLTHFLAKWEAKNTEMAQHPPDAGFVFYKVTNKKFTDIPLTIKDPKLEGDTLIFRTTPLLDAASLPKEEIEEVTLFIDSHYLEID